MYDTIIIGCGVSGMSAAIYLKRAGKKVKIFENEAIGGAIASSPRVENYPGYKSISGVDLANNFYEQLEALDLDVDFEEVLSIKDGKIKEVTTDSGTYKTKTIILAMGSRFRRLGLDHEEDLIGNGISFCVACDGAFYKDKEVAVIGGGNSAVGNALALSEYCKKIYVVQNLSTLTAEEESIKKLKEKDNIELICDSVVTKLIGEEELTGIEIDTNGKKSELAISGMFISIGQIPNTKIVKDLVKLDKFGYIEADLDCQTNKEGIFASGDVRSKKVRQLTTATADGTVSALAAISYLER